MNQGNLSWCRVDFFLPTTHGSHFLPTHDVMASPISSKKKKKGDNA